jgi:purine-binding chemotaxis protein CheW
VIRAVEITALPKAPKIVIGVINEHGRIIPVVDIRARFRLPAREPGIADCLIIVRTPRRLVALLVDCVIGIREFPDGRIVSAASALPFAEYLRGVVQLEDELVLINDLDRFLSLDEERNLDVALAGGEA